MGRGSELKFAKRLRERMQLDLPSYRVDVGENLVYKLIVDSQRKIAPEHIEEPRRGQYAFQTDLLVTGRRHKTPLVAVEIKYGAFSTHDVLIYSTKALKHKEVYPYLRYGFVVAGAKASLDQRFFIHNVGFDFGYAMKSPSTGYGAFLKAVRGQLQTAKTLIRIMNQTQTIGCYESVVRIH